MKTNKKYAVNFSVVKITASIRNLLGDNDEYVGRYYRV